MRTKKQKRCGASKIICDSFERDEAFGNTPARIIYLVNIQYTVYNYIYISKVDLCMIVCILFQFIYCMYIVPVHLLYSWLPCFIMLKHIS